MLEDNELQLCDIVGVNPVFGSLSDKACLASTSSTITLDWVSSGSDKVVELRQLDDRCIVIFLKNGLALSRVSKTGRKCHPVIFCYWELELTKRLKMQAMLTSCFLMILEKPV